MATETNQFAHLTEKCQNFKNYLATNFQVMNFGEFACAYTFSFEEVKSLIEAASNDYRQPAFFRVYYGCDALGLNHQLFFAILDADENVILIQELTNVLANDTSQAETDFLKSNLNAAQSFKCPPGGSNDLIIRTLL